MARPVIAYVVVPPGKLDPVRADGKWQEIAKALLSDISDGRLRIGDRVPSIGDLSAKYQVTRKTATKAVAHLRDLGIVTSRPSSGTWVAALPVDDEIPPSVARTVLGRLDDQEAALERMAAEVTDLRARVEELERGDHARGDHP